MWVRDALISETATNPALGRPGGTECVRVSARSANLASYDYFLVEKPLAAFAILLGRFQESPYAHQLLTALMTLHHWPFEVERQPEPSIRSSSTSYASHGRSRPRLPNLVTTLHHGSSGFANNAPCDTVLF